MDNEKRLQLKEKAEKALNLTRQVELSSDPETFDHIIEELQIYQVELELQNEELVNSQDNLQKQLAHTRRLFNSLPSAAVVIDEQGLMTEINESAIRLFGFNNRSSARNHSIFRLLDSASGNWMYDALHSNDYQSTLNKDLALGKNSHNWIPVNARVLLIPADSDIEGKAIVIFRDLTSERVAKQQQQQFQTIINNSRNLIFVVDSDFQLQLANEAFKELCQLSANDSIIGSNLLDLLLVDEVIEMQRLIMDVLASNKSVYLPSQKLTLHRESKYFSCQAFPIELYDPGSQGVSVVASDITELFNANAKIQEMAFYDALTGAANRVLLNDRIDQLIQAHHRDKRTFAVFFIDLDHFKDVNDLYGHNTGDRLLISIASRLREVCRPQDTVARLGGDEFIVLMSDISKAESEQRGHELLETVRRPLKEIDNHLLISASIGVALFPADASDRSDILQYADAAMYQAKDRGKNQVFFFNHTLITAIKQRATLSNAMRNAIDNNELFVELQPLIHINDNSLCGAEVLLRWRSEVLGQIPPDEFIPIAESNGTIREIGRWVMLRSFEFLQTYAKSLPAHFKLAINVSGNELWEEDYALKFSEQVNHFKINPQQIELELTETVAMQRPEQAKLIFTALKSLGIQIALDDFGTGYSSLGYLKQLPIDSVKIDKTFVTDIGQSKDSEAICTAIVSLGNALGLSSTAEGIETQSQLEFMKSLGCDIAQGYFFAKPMSISAFIERFASN